MGGGLAVPGAYGVLATAGPTWKAPTTPATAWYSQPTLQGWPGPQETEAQASARQAGNQRLTAQAQNRQAGLSSIDLLMSKYGPYASGTYGSGAGSTGWGGVTPTVAPPATPAPVAAPTPPDTSAADAATWARAKDAIARSTAGAQKTLQGQQAARGFGRESGVYAQEENALNQTGLTQLGDTAREQAINNLAAERAATQAAYEGAITQRGQDVGLTSSGYSGLVSQRGQDLALLQARMGWTGLMPSLMALVENAAY